MSPKKIKPGRCYQTRYGVGRVEEVHGAGRWAKVRIVLESGLRYLSPRDVEHEVEAPKGAQPQ